MEWGDFCHSTIWPCMHWPGWNSFWNDRVKALYSFIDFPLIPRLSFYKKGIDEVENQSSYAGLLCSLYYHSFFVGAKGPAAIEFSRQEKSRQNRLMEQLNLFEAHKKDLLKNHFLIIQFFDNLSLYLCIQEPGTPKAEEFPWFNYGFPEFFPLQTDIKLLENGWTLNGYYFVLVL